MTKAIIQRTPELSRLLRLVEERYGRSIHTTTDFESLSVVIELETGEYLSASTLKRLWGYVSLHPAPRFATLDVLCRFIGYPSFAAFRQALKDDPAFESDFFTTHFVSAEQMRPGERLTIGWDPNRLVTMDYLGENRWRVCCSENAKLLPGDEFTASQFLLGYPLFLDRILRDGAWTPSYVAGKRNGLTVLQKASEEPSE